jgi:hypothetical protein
MGSSQNSGHWITHQLELSSVRTIISKVSFYRAGEHEILKRQKDRYATKEARSDLSWVDEPKFQSRYDSKMQLKIESHYKAIRLILKHYRHLSVLNVRRFQELW